MPQLNIHVPTSSDLLARIDAAARQLGTSPSALARVVLDVALEPYVQAQFDLRQQEHAYSVRVVAALRDRFSGALPARPFVTSDAAVDLGPVDQDLSDRGETTGGHVHGARRSAAPVARAGHAPNENGVGRPARPAAAGRAVDAGPVPRRTRGAGGAAGTRRVAAATR
jgi:hypothetical protein